MAKQRLGSVKYHSAQQQRRRRRCPPLVCGDNSEADGINGASLPATTKWRGGRKTGEQGGVTSAWACQRQYIHVATSLTTVDKA